MNRFELAGAAFARLCETMATLRRRCPWDREQTLESLKGYLLEETYEVIEAIDQSEPDRHRDELGDLLLQVVFQSEIAHENGSFEVAAVADGINRKLIRRHPHVFATDGTLVDDPPPKAKAGSKRVWESIKSRERGPGASRLDGIPKAMPALLRALRMGEKAATVGFDWPSWQGVTEKVEEEWLELKEHLGGNRRLEGEELGDLLLALVNLCRHRRIDPEAALGAAIRKFERRFRKVEKAAGEQSAKMSDLTLDQLDALWEDAKSFER